MNTVNRIALRRLIAATGVAIFSLVAVACDSDDAADTTVAATNGAVTEVTVSGQWARTSPMDAANGAAYATIACPSDDALVGAAVDATAAQKVELHETVMGGATGDTATIRALWPNLTKAFAGGTLARIAPHRDHAMGEFDLRNPHGGVLQLRLVRPRVATGMGERVDAGAGHECAAPVHRHEDFACQIGRAHV